MGALRRAVLRLFATLRGDRAEDELAREIHAHLQLLEDRFRAQGLSADDGRRAARRAFGGIEQVKERHRDERSIRPLGHACLDLKLGARMLVKHPGLTLVGGLGMAVASAIAAGVFVVLSGITNPVLPLDEGERLVSLQNWDASKANPERRVLHDFLTWRDGFRSVQDVAAYRTVVRNLIVAGAQVETVRIAEMTAAGFRAARVPPLLGRYLIDEDDREGAAPVVVIGQDVWRTRFASDPAIVGRIIQLGPTEHAIVGVMPETFRFPVSHRFWVPLRAEPSHLEPLQGPELMVFGRLAPGVALEAAQAELAAMGHRASAAFPATHQHLRPMVLPYAYAFLEPTQDPANVRWLQLARFLMTLLLAVVCVNVAILVYARTATRQAEIALRSALGASRRRIVAQLFLEALVLSTAAAGAGLALTAVGLSYLEAGFRQFIPEFPFWIDLGLSARAVVYLLGLAILAAVIVGVLPAIKATGRRVQHDLKRLETGSSGMQLGRTWTALVVAQVAFAVAILPMAVYHALTALKAASIDPGSAVVEYLTAELIVDRTAGSGFAADEREFGLLYRRRHEELVRRLEPEPGVSEVTWSMAVPGGEPTVWIEVEGLPTPPESAAESSGYAVRSGRFGHEARFNRVDVGFFQAFAIPILAGRVFEARDATPTADAIVVNRAFARQVVGRDGVLGRRIRYIGRSGDARPDLVELDRWYEIVGVVEDFPAKPREAGAVDARLYHAAAPGQIHPVHLAIRAEGPVASTFAARLREIAAAVDPNLQVRHVATLDDVLRQDQQLLWLLAASLAVLTLSVVLLSAAGIYALMSFTVTRRRKEIGIRAALGADPRRIVRSIFSRAFTQLGTGAIMGVMVAALLDRLSGNDLMGGQGLVVLPLVAAFMMLVGLVAAAGPARQGLRIDLTQTLRDQ